MIIEDLQLFGKYLHFLNYHLYNFYIMVCALVLEQKFSIKMISVYFSIHETPLLEL